ncbi:hypothetical protein PtrM4_057920 [Pyrenophora tritici-repentis]|uniref:Uncharacterized protein n=1 Tax=Pyrenophora tritici-repentis TaxID=45151 RepID=A0A834S262_9PLEO|nr:hypothetical protein PtrM4_057920 [Pyrenophora tritici-repentis]
MANVRASKRAAAAAVLDAPSTPKHSWSKCDIASQAIVVGNVSVHLVHGFISCTPNTILAISKMRLYNAT